MHHTADDYPYPDMGETGPSEAKCQYMGVSVSIGALKDTRDIPQITRTVITGGGTIPDFCVFSVLSVSLW